MPYMYYWSVANQQKIPLQHYWIQFKSHFLMKMFLAMIITCLVLVCFSLVCFRLYSLLIMLCSFSISLSVLVFVVFWERTGCVVSGFAVFRSHDLTVYVSSGIALLRDLALRFDCSCQESIRLKTTNQIFLENCSAWRLFNLCSSFPKQLNILIVLCAWIMLNISFHALLTDQKVIIENSI